MFDKIQAGLFSLFFFYFQWVLWDTGEHARHVVITLGSTLFAMAIRYTLQALHWAGSRLALTVKRSG
jgi:hypothetical protein